MITMRSTSVTKMTKPPPPVPPRPSKTIVAEALAKRRRLPEDTNTVPVRSAPPPPVDLSRSQSSVNFQLRKPTVYERSISNELKSSRTVIFQSSNMKSAKNNVLVRNDSQKKVTISNPYVNSMEKLSNNKVISELQETKNDVIVTTKNILNSSDVPENTIKITQIKEESSKRASLDLSQPPLNNGVTVNSQIVTCVVQNQNETDPNKNTNLSKPSGSVEKLSVSPTGSLGNSINIEDSHFDEKWDGMLKDKNHVNKLIDEMFASVLQASNGDEVKCQTAKVSTDSTTITINGYDNKYESSCSVETNGPTVLIIESGDSAKIEPQTNGNNKESVEKLEFSYDKSNSSTMEKKSVKFDDKQNAEFLIEELESMRIEQEKIMKRQRKPSLNFYGSADGEDCDNEDNINYHINIVNLGKGSATLDYDRLKTMSSLHGLPPLPKSLSGFNLDENYSNPPTPARSSSMRSHQGPGSLGSGHLAYSHHKGANGTSDCSSMSQGRKSTNLDAQLAILKREMYSLRQLDLSLLSQLWSLNESIQDFRQILQEQEDCRVLSPPSPSPAPSSGDEGDGEDQYYVNAPPATPSIKFRPAPPPPPARRSSNSSNASTGG